MLKPCIGAALLLVGLAAISHPAVAGTLPATLAAALAGGELDAADAWSFRKTTEVSAMDRKHVRTVTRWDPSKPAGQRCVVVSVEVLQGDASDAKDEGACHDGTGRETYGELKTLIEDATVEPLTENASMAEYRIVPGPGQKGFNMGSMHVDIGGSGSEDLVGKVHVVKTGPGAPYVDQVVLNLKEPSGNLLARVDKLDITFSYAPDPATGAKLMRGMGIDLDMKFLAVLGMKTLVSTRFDEYKRIK